MKKKFSYKDILYKSKRLMVLGLVVVLGTGVIVTSGLSGNDEIPVHDGEVLVDSLTAAGEISSLLLWIRLSITVQMMQKKTTLLPKKTGSWNIWKKNWT